MKSREQVNAALAKLVSDGKISSEQAQLVAEELDPTSQGKSLSRVAEIGSYAGATLVAGAGLWMGIELTEGMFSTNQLAHLFHNFRLYFLQA